MRTRAIFCCLWFSVVPWWLYERNCHYAGMSYLSHLVLNLGLAWEWLRGKPSEELVAFEKKVNPSWKVVRRNMLLICR